jgi:hypothetical protein
MENAPPRIRPGLVTAIALVTWLSFAWTLFTGALLGSGILPNTVAAQQYFMAFTRWDWAILSLLSAIHLAAVTLLWFMRRDALWWFMASTFLGGINSGRFLVTHGLVNLYATLGPMGSVVSFVMSYVLSLVVSAAILAYIVTLYRRGALE